MKTKFYHLLTFVVIVTTSFTVSNSFFNTDLAYAQSNKLTKEFDGGGGGGGGCNGATCDDANGNHYGDFQAGSVLTCCGGSAPSSGKKTF
jgi:hypothetical protein